MAAGLGFKTFQVGEVLLSSDVNGYLMQGVLVFASAAARDAAITSPQEGQACYLKDTDAVLTYSGTAWVGFDDSNAIQNSIVDAKGDIVAASGNDTPARLAVGNDGETLVADSSTATGLRYQVPVNVNPVINSAMQVFQRGTSFSIAASTGAGSTTFSADRWQTATGANQAVTLSRQTTSDTTNLPFIQFGLRYQRNNAQTGTGDLNFAQNIESVNSIPFAGKIVTLSFYAKKGALYSASASALGVTLYAATSTDGNVLTGGFTSATTPIASTATLTTTWQRFSFTSTAIATNASQLAPVFTFTPVGTAGATDFFEITGVQLEVGSVATPFKTYAGTIQGELAACQRYYYRQVATSSNGSFGTGQVVAATGGYFVFQYPVTMRTTPSTLEQTGTASNYGVWNSSSSIVACSAVPSIVGAYSNPSSGLINFSVSSGLTAGNATIFVSNGITTAFLGFSAEL